MKKLAMLLSLLLGFISCVDTYETSLCEKVISEDSFVGEYKVNLEQNPLPLKGDAEIVKNNDGTYNITYYQSLNGEQLSDDFRVCENKNEEKFIEYIFEDQEKTSFRYSPYEKSSDGFIIKHVQFEREALDNASIPYQNDEYDLGDFSFEMGHIMNTERDAEVLINNTYINDREILTRI